MTTLLSGHANFWVRELFVVCHHPDKSCGHKHCDNVLIYHVTSREHMFKELCEFMNGSHSRSVITLPFLVAIDLVQVKI